MPWKETWPVRERQEMLALYRTGMYTVTELARHFAVSRKTLHKWLARMVKGEEDGLENRSRAPHTHPNATQEKVVQAVIGAKLAHPTWGPLKLSPGPQVPEAIAAAWPAPSTRGAILARAGLTTPRRRRRRVAPYTQPFACCDGPNSTWCADFKGWFRTTDGKRCDPLTITDGYSRMLLCCQGLARTDYGQVRPYFERTFREYGLPAVIRTDNGPPFASMGVGGLSRLSVWWIKLGILPERIEPGHPEQNGRHERMHRTLKHDCLHPPAATMAAQQRIFDAFRCSFNTERPHQALGLQPPALSYGPSPRSFPTRLTDPEYLAGTQIRRVRSNGQVKWQGHLIFVGEALTGEAIGIQETTDCWLAWFGPILLGQLDPIRRSIQRPQPSAQSVTHVPS